VSNEEEDMSFVHKNDFAELNFANGIKWCAV
jgi:hypothetical protein